MYRNYGDLEFMIRYYELLALNEDVTRMEGICKDDHVKNQALFVYIYSLIKPIFGIDLSALIRIERTLRMPAWSILSFQG